MTLQLAPGSVLGRYELLMPAAKGNMAQVWVARLHGTRGFHKFVAVKTILASETPELRSEAMLLEEARLAALVHHPNVVTTLDLGEERGVLYLVMEWVHGESLRELFKRALVAGRVPLDIAVNLMAQACKGLHAAHEARGPDGAPLHLVHRDISPQNLLISYSGVVKVADFGIAKAQVKAAELTHPGEVKGKVAFMSPEQLACAPLDRRSDIFAMGTLLYMLTTGHHPFRGATASKTLSNIMEWDPPRPAAVLKHYPADLERVVLKALAKDPRERFQTAAELLSALVATQEGVQSGEYEAPVAEYMRQLMGDRERERLELLSRSHHSTTSRNSSPPPSPRPSDVWTTSLPHRELVTPAAQIPQPNDASVTSGPKDHASRLATGGRRRTLWMLGALSGTLLAGLAATTWNPTAFQVPGTASLQGKQATTPPPRPTTGAASFAVGAVPLALSASRPDVVDSAPSEPRPSASGTVTLENVHVAASAPRSHSSRSRPTVTRDTAPPLSTSVARSSAAEEPSHTSATPRSVTEGRDAWDRTRFGGRN